MENYNPPQAERYPFSVLDLQLYYDIRAAAFDTASRKPVAARFGLIDQPTETVDTILSHLNAHRDAVNIGLPYTRVRDVAPVRHFEYHAIRYKESIPYAL
ncbi:hypothetical protein HYPSUDRAFT_908938 [Hypholoma sublateritium FD-334 SS-4]|uniref:Uncharacterized protein n=1 Tax=Hypholoma sublateritium (strain FD-334 SS-4) TaxID=945553 RepID=A0A0D2NQE1_HYPSF|nr:hypothetical protein HYPSUDRAFT_908938 [Hypholoma sublateritium FD-334 SS-4]